MFMIYKELSAQNMAKLPKFNFYFTIEIIKLFEFLKTSELTETKARWSNDQ